MEKSGKKLASTADHQASNPHHHHHKHKGKGLNPSSLPLAPGKGSAHTIVPHAEEVDPPLVSNNKNDESLLDAHKESEDARQSSNIGPKDSDSLTNNHEKHGEKLGRGGGRFIIRNLWEVCCNETEGEVKELNSILTKLGLPPVNYTKSKTYELTDYELPPDLHACKSKDFLDFYVFPYLLPAIQALIQFARVNRVFQCRFCTFNALDYIVEYLYNNNPRYPDRLENPTPIFEIPFAKAWLAKHPRRPPPKWMLMSSEEAAIIIQRAIRGYMVRCRPDVQEMRQFWRDYRKDMEEEISVYGRSLPKNFSTTGMFSPYYEELRGEFESTNAFSAAAELPVDGFHSDQCVYCRAFREFLNNQPDIGGLSSQYLGSANSKTTITGNDSVPKLSIITDLQEGEAEEILQNNLKTSLGAGLLPPTLNIEAASSVEPSFLTASKAHKPSPSQKKSVSAAIHKNKQQKMNNLLRKQEG